MKCNHLFSEKDLGVGRNLLVCVRCQAVREVVESNDEYTTYTSNDTSGVPTTTTSTPGHEGHGRYYSKDGLTEYCSCGEIISILSS